MLWRFATPPTWRRRAAAVLALLPAPAAAQRPAPNLGVDHFGVGDGLPGMSVSDIAITTDGRLWLTASGILVSFDGFEFETHDLAEFAADTPTLRDVGAGRADTLWVVVGNQLYSHVGEHTHERARLEGRPYQVWQNEQGEIRVLDERGVVRVVGEGTEREVRLRPFWNAGDSAEEQSGAGRWLHPLRTGTTKRIHESWFLDPIPFPDGWPGRVDGGSALLTETRADGTTIVTREDGTPVTRLRAPAGRLPLMIDGRGWIWSSVPGRAIAVDSTGAVVAELPLAPGARAVSAAEDVEGNVWLGTVTDGLYRIRPRPVRVLGAAEGLTDGQVRRVYGTDGGVLALHDDGRVTRWRAGVVDTVFEPTAVSRAESALIDRRGTVWVSYIEPEHHRFRGRAADGREWRAELPAAARMLEDPLEDGVLWMLSGQLSRVRLYGPAGPVAEPVLDDGWQWRDMLIDPEGAVWAVGERGMARVRPDGSVDRYRVEEGHPMAGGRAFHRSSDGTIWIGTYQSGIVRFRDGEFLAVRAADGLWDDGVSSILEDDAGNFWMGSNRGVHRVARQELDAFLAGDLARVHGYGYGQEAGFRNAEASGWPAYRSPDGRLWFPTFGGLAVIDPADALAAEQIPPRIRVREVGSEGALQPADTVLRLRRGQRRIEIGYGAILLSGHDGIRYEVRLDGVDTDWVDAGRQRQVTYGNVPPGRHVFHARAISGAGVTSLREAQTALVVPPFFHETAAFRLLVLLMGMSVLWFAYHLRMRRMRLREATLERLVDERTHALARSKAETEKALVTVEAQARELRSLDEAKSRFFANVSHELRTPLTLVQGPLQDVLDGRLGETPPAVREQVATVLASGRRLGELVEQLLDVARLESGTFRLHVRQHDLGPLFDRLAHSFAALARRNGLAFEATWPEGGILASVDADQIEKVCANLLSNAVKFTPEGGRVSFTVDLEEDGGRELVIVVEDDGPGIPPDEHARIFERFHQVDGSASRTHEGTGLGLALVKEVAELHGGSVALVSEGRGSRFTVRVPAGDTATVAVPEAVSMPAVEAPPAAPDRPDPEAPPASQQTDGAALADVRDAADPDDAARPTILVVEDHDELRGYLRRHLEERYRVIEADNGAAGLAEALRTVPDLILCDIMMPGMDGEAMCRAIRADPEVAYLPVIMVTAKASRHSRLSALEGGADDYLVKPFDPEELRLRIANALASRKRLAERLRTQGKAMPFVPADLPDSGPERDFTVALDAVLRTHMADEDFGVDDMANALAMSRATLYRKAEEALGKSPMELLWSFRLEQAAHWLRETDGTVSEVAYASGFKTVPHFTRRFRERFGATPAAYRRQRG